MYKFSVVFERKHTTNWCTFLP